MNQEIRKLARGNMIPFWEIAQRIGVCEMTITRWMRTELTEKRRSRMMDAMESILKERGNA